MTEPVEFLERRISQLRAAVREAVLAGDNERASALRRELRQAEQDWEDALGQAQDAGRGDREPAARPAACWPFLPGRWSVVSSDRCLRASIS